MLNGTFKALIAVLTLAGALGATSAATTTRRASSITAARKAEIAPRHRPRKDDGCVEAAAPTLVQISAPPVASCSGPVGTAP